MQARKQDFYTNILARPGINYYIPVYQRNYSWTTTECQSLVEDLMNLYNNKTNKHFIGTLVWKTEDGNSANYIIIDGQQRFTTINILLKALQDSCEIDNVRREIGDSLFNHYSDVKIKLVPNPSDKLVYDLIMEDRSIDVVDKTNSIYLNYCHFLNFFIKQDIDAKLFLGSIKKLEIVEIELHQEDDAQVIFESINSTGVSLSVGDLIRNYLLMGLDYDLQSSLFERYWYNFEQKLGTNELSYFFECFLHLKSNGNLNKAKMYDAFKEYYLNFDREITEEKFFSYLNDYINAYALILGIDKFNDKELDDLIVDYNQINAVQTAIFLMEVVVWYKQEKISKDDLAYTINTVNSYNFRRQVIGGNTGVAKLFAILADGILSDMNKGLTYVEALNINFIYKRKNTSSEFPDDKSFIQRLETRDLYKNFSNTKYLLVNLNAYLSNAKTKYNYDDESITIEHVMPQSINKWLNVLSQDDVDSHLDYIHDLGNLTLTSINSDISNAPFSEKKEFYYNEGYIKLNNYFNEIDIWNIESIVKRGQELAKVAVKIWPHPEVDATNYNKLQQEHKLSNCQIINLSEVKEYDIFTGRKPIGMLVNNEFVERNSYTMLLEYIVSRYATLDFESFVEKVVMCDENKKKLGDGYHFHIDKTKVLYPWNIANIYTCEGASASHRTWLMALIAKQLEIEISICLVFD